MTFVRFFLAPLKDIGTAVSEFIRALLIDLPLTLYPVAIAIVAVFSFMFLFMWFGYSIRLPFFLTIERPAAQLSVADSKLNEALTDSSQQIMKQVKDCINYLFFQVILNDISNSLLAHLSRRLIGELIVNEGIRRPSVVCPSVNIFKQHLWSHKADSFHISHIASIGRGNEKLCFLFQSDKTSGCYGNL